MSEQAVVDAIKPDTKKWRPQISLLTISLLITATAIWLAYFRAGQIQRRLATEVNSMEAFARELKVLEENKYAIVAPHPTKIGEAIWKIYIPKQAASELHLKMGEIGLLRQASTDVFDSPDQTVPLPAGKHILELGYERGKSEAVVTVTLDGKEIMRAKRDSNWEPGIGSSGGRQFGELTTVAADKRLVLYHRRYSTKPNGTTAPKGPWHPTVD